MPRTILLADDSVTIRKVVQLAFGETDYRVEAVGSGAQALDRLAASKPDLVLVDVVMPEPSGYDVCRAVKQSERPVPVLLLTGTFEPFDADRAAACGADGHVVKPFDPRDLLERVELLLRRHPVPADKAPPPAAPPIPTEAPPPSDADTSDDIETIFRSLDAGEDAAVPDSAPISELPPAPEPLPATPTAEPAGAEEPPGPRTAWTDAEIDAIAAAVVARLSDRVLREIAWDVVPDLAERVVRERLRELEKEGAGEA